MTFDEIESCFPEGSVSLEDGWTGVTAQWLHDFANNIADKQNELCAQMCENLPYGGQEACMCADEIRRSAIRK